MLFHCRQIQGCELAFVKRDTTVIQCRIVTCIFDLVLDSTVVEKPLKIADVVLTTVFADALDHEPVGGTSDGERAILVFGQAVVG